MLTKKTQEVPRSIFVGVASNLFSPPGGTSSKREHYVLSFFFQLIFLKISAEAPVVDVFLRVFFLRGSSHILHCSHAIRSPHDCSKYSYRARKIHVYSRCILNCLSTEQLNECMNKYNNCLLLCQYYCAV